MRTWPRRATSGSQPRGALDAHGGPAPDLAWRLLPASSISFASLSTPEATACPPGALASLSFCQYLLKFPLSP